MKALTLIVPCAIAIALLAAWLWTPDRSRAALEALYLREPADMMEVSGVRLHVRDTGPRDAPAILMLHGFGSSLHTWEPWAEALSDQYRVVRLDLPGSGLSPSDPSANYTDTRTLTLLLALMNQLGIDRASLIGNSIGGRIAWTFAAAHPDRTNRLILISPDGFASPGFAYNEAPEVSPLLGVMRYVLPKAVLRVNLAQSYGDPSVLTPATVDRYYDLMRAPGARAALLDRMGQTILIPPEQQLRSIEAPVLLLWGERDALIPFSNASDYSANLRDSRLVSFPTLGHVPHEESPMESLAPVRAFLVEGS
ncbi:alpha/beta fold hydrolase [Terricaulis sp.]|uniref:alpha/beta fold hydrolase n=1 Tax=Terricaulis sp. TaxID=2768686 RepID=UPI002AC3F128|nr:alpha/beta fold hydrolase [Terricaulis sp.]MDZ4691028.1 alpha/beta fold hydrolase [Terricaulis sp.]